MAESKMPAKIWAEEEDADKDSGLWCLEPYFDAAAYIRADLVEPLVEALRGMLSWAEARPDKHPLDTWNAGRDALAAYTAAQSGQAQTEARE